MVGQMWSKWFLIFIVHAEKVLGDEYTLSRNKTDLGQSIIPCHINYNEDSTPHTEDNNSFTSYEVLISTPWMIHKEFTQNPEDQDQLDKTCLLAKQIDEGRVKYKAVSCSEQHPAICFLSNGGNIQDGSTASLSIQSAEDTCFTINLQCNLTIQPMCTVLDDAGINIYEATTTSCEVQQSQMTSIKQSTVMTSEVETKSEPNNAEWTSTYNSSSFGSVITINGGSFLEYIVSTSVVFGILVLIIFDIWICKKVKEANKRKRNVSSPRNNVSHSQPCENVLNSVEYDEVNPAGMIDMTFPQVIDITVIEENNDAETRRNHSYVNQLAQHASISLHDLLRDDNEYEHPYHTLMDNGLSSQHEYSSANTKPEYENTKI